MLRKRLEQELRRLSDEVIALGDMAGKAILEAVEILKKRDFEGSRRLMDEDRLINNKRFEIEADILILIATQQPMAGDLRKLAAMLEIIGELERVGDYAKGIANINLMIGEKPLIKPLIDLPRMAEKACSMLDGALEAFARDDIELARAVPEQDDEVDALYNQVYRELVGFIITDPQHAAEQANCLLWAAHNLERAADRATNICERVIFTVTGGMKELDTHFESSLID